MPSTTTSVAGTLKMVYGPALNPVSAAIRLVRSVSPEQYNKLHTPWPVSYTHLDVYKRQILGHLGQDAVKQVVVIIPIFTVHIAVSYTHLDVYKRQLRYLSQGNRLSV